MLDKLPMTLETPATRLQTYVQQAHVLSSLRFTSKRATQLETICSRDISFHTTQAVYTRSIHQQSEMGRRCSIGHLRIATASSSHPKATASEPTTTGVG